MKFLLPGYRVEGQEEAQTEPENSTPTSKRIQKRHGLER